MSQSPSSYQADSNVFSAFGHGGYLEAGGSNCLVIKLGLGEDAKHGSATGLEDAAYLAESLRVVRDVLEDGGAEYPIEDAVAER